MGRNACRCTHPGIFIDGEILTGVNPAKPGNTLVSIDCCTTVPSSPPKAPPDGQ
ncbi:hypothetical protein [Rouxiella badensis]|uniref:hypothetical protein n=1 Tax=Rouxiella badensis TaxID=1646377 RepID=UPI001CE3EBE9|nr:hypothetical protein [Rouxiella badensis]